MLRKDAIGLTVEEIRKVVKLIGRDPTVVEAVIWGIQGSEHCSYKSSKRFLKQFPTNGKHVILGPGEDSGIIAITDTPDGKRWGIVASHESHNHPSQIVPYEGAATGVGGIVRDVLCMGARVVGIMDPLRLGDLKTEESRHIAKEVVRGIGGYGNPLGIPNIGGDVQFDSGYNFNCLVNVVCHGIVREDEIIHSFVPEEAGKENYDIILVGKPTDRSGFGGAAFASLALEESKKEKNSGAVQEPNPFLERHLLVATYSLFDWLASKGQLHRVSFKDLGAGGVVCASVEQVAHRGLGADIDLDAVHTAMDGLPPEIVACAETQERFCWMCHPSLTNHIISHYNDKWELPSIADNARASLIGKVTTGPAYKLRFCGEIVCDVLSRHITCGIEYERPVKAKPPNAEMSGSAIHVARNNIGIKDAFIKIISNPNHASKSPIFRHYDKNVMGNTVVEPGEADAGVIAPLQNLKSYVFEGIHPNWDISDSDKWIGVAVACDGNGRYGKISPYWQGVNAAIESMRNVAAVGASPRALTDCLNYGNPENEEELWDLSEGIRGIADAAKNMEIEGYPVPVISGNVSLYNSTPEGTIPPTAIVSCIGVLQDARKAVTMKVKDHDLAIFLVGKREDECGGSAYYESLGEAGGNIPKPDFYETKKQIQFVIDAIGKGTVKNCHDISEGGLLMALFETLVPVSIADAPEIGMKISLAGIGSDLSEDKLLFSETGGFVIATNMPDECVELAEFHDVEIFNIGRTTKSASLEIKSVESFDLERLFGIWKKSLEEILGL